MLVRLGTASILALLLLYGAFEAWPLLSGPALSITSPKDFETVTDGRLTLSGTAKHTETLLFAGGTLLIDEEGNFETVLTLPSGGVILSLTATDRFGRSRTEQRTVFVP